MNVLSSGVHDKIVGAFEESARNLIARNVGKGGNRDKLKLIRRALNLTQEQFAEAFCLPYTTVRNWEQPGNEPNEAGQLLIDMIVEDHKAMFEVAEKVQQRRKLAASET